MGNLRQSQTTKTLTSQQQQPSPSTKPELHPIEELQGIIGNRALGHLIKSQHQNSHSEAGYQQKVARTIDPLLSSLSPVTGQSIQRMPMFRGLSHELRGNWQQGNPVQPKLTIGQVGDKYEQEADRVASEVVRQINPPVSSLSTQHESIQRQDEESTSHSSTIRALAQGKVIFAGWYNGCGNTVKIDHGNGLVTRYAHNRKLYVSQEQVVQQGEPIAAARSKVRSTAPHLHFEVLMHKTPRSPSIYIRRQCFEYS
ncbi:MULTISPECIES: M23 family metallopeptidase [Moorena]|uniref:M23 family metallopeptidase n=1 Tax=Moorena producens (strain JHB) TaxID=1454205 RepID=A0A1D9G2Y1_MOOP1|nr:MULTISPECIES: M23 family metallopeptidase [Moorena]AOY81875.1 M23 family metallopeptidase [Moorena producens JHB]